MTIDPQIIRCIALALAGLFLLAGLHKLQRPAEFRGVLQQYRVLPESFLSFAAKMIPVVELILGVGWLASLFLAAVPTAIGLGSSMLLGAYGSAMAINLLRGRHYIDCGCSLSSNNSQNSALTHQQISYRLVFRNFALAALALAVLLPSSLRTFHLLDHLFLLPTVITLTFAYGAFNQIAANRGIINSWRKANG